MLRTQDDLATKADVNAVREDMDSVREDLRNEMSALRTELRQEIVAVRADLRSFIRTFIAVQAGTVIGVAGIFYALIRLT